MSRWIKLSVIAATATLTVLPLVTPAADAQTIYVNPQPYPQQAQQPPRGGAWGDRDRDGIPNAFDQYNNNRRRGGGDQDHGADEARLARGQPGKPRPRVAGEERQVAGKNFDRLFLFEQNCQT